MSADHHFSEKDPAVLEAVEKQYLYGRTKDVLQNIEKDVLGILKDVMRCHRLEMDYLDSVSTLELISVALVRLRERHFSESEMKLLVVFKRRIRFAIDQFLDVFHFSDSEYGRTASRLMSALYSLNTQVLSARDFLTESDGMGAKVIEGALNTIDIIESIAAAVRSKLTPKKDKEGASHTKQV